ncbi:hypothetical protein AaE_015405 [Aphanomyces astaci]|uniref:Integrase catalytic domain-containing protein n=1 Tax=Aphanomyces astaci TaxID=112090 RepID=A0A6A4Z1E8_APHAT|nr:hypothetical protein AaE_015405 [Aphanomyces astaci]
MPPITLMTHNFASWRVWFIAKLQTKRLANYLDWDGTVAQGANGFEYNELDNLRALGILTESLSESQYQYVDGALLVKTAMDNLTAIHEPIGAADRVALLEEYHTLSWDWKNVPLEEFLGTFRDLTRRLDRAALNELPSFRVTKLLSLMPKEMRMVSHMIMDSNAEFHTVPIAVTKLITEYKYLQKEGILKVRGRNMNDAVLVVHHDRRPPIECGDERQRSRGHDKCHNCGTIGHWARDCRRPDRGTQVSQSRRGRGQREPRQVAPPSAHANAVRSEPVYDEDYLFSIGPKMPSDQPHELSSRKSSLPLSTLRMVVDSGASCHITGNLDILYDRVACERSVVVADGHRMHITQMGKVRLASIDGAHLVLTDVLYEPSVTNTLVSISRITVDNPDVDVSFSGQVCSIRAGGCQIATARFDPRSKLFILEGDVCTHLDDFVGVVVGDAVQAARSTPPTSTTLPPRTIDLWHFRMGHVMLENMRWSSMQCPELPKFDSKLSLCECCQTSKMTRVPHPPRATRRWSLGELVHSDIKGPMRTTTNGGGRYMLSYIEDFSGYAWTKILRNKSDQADAFLMEYLPWLERQTGTKLKCLRSDNGGEYLSKEFSQSLTTLGIKHETSAVDSQFQNGKAERFNRTIFEMALAMLTHASMARVWWGEAINTATFLRNRLVNSVDRVKSPIELLLGQKPNLSNWKVWGCICFHLLPYQAKRDKLRPKAVKCIFLGYSDTQKAYRLLDLDANKLVFSVNVKFFESIFLHDDLPEEYPSDSGSEDGESADDNGGTDGGDDDAPPHDDPPHNAGNDSDDDDSFPANDANAPHALGPALPPRNSSSSLPPRTIRHSLENLLGIPARQRDARAARRDAERTQREREHERSERDARAARRDVERTQRDRDHERSQRQLQHTPTGNNGQPHATIRGQDFNARLRDQNHQERQENAHGARNNVERNEPRHSTRPRRPPNRSPDEGYAYASMDPLDYCYNIETDVPRGHNAAMRSTEAREWKQAEQVAIDAMTANGTWEIQQVPTSQRSLRCHWVYAKKIDSEGNVTRYKARLVANGSTQEQGVDYFQSYSPVVKLVTLRTVISFATANEYRMEQADAVDAYLQSFLPENERIIMDQPPGHQLGPMGSKLRMIRPLWGLKQSGLHWNVYCDAGLKKIGFVPSLHDPCLYTRTSNGKITLLCVYVDDFLIAAPTKEAVVAVLDAMEGDGKIRLKRQGALQYLLGIKISQADGITTLNQATYAKAVLKRFGMENCSRVATPEVVGSEDEWDEPGEPADVDVFQSMVGSLVYLMSCTCPDLAHSIQRLSRYLHRPTTKHIEGAKRVLRYIKGTMEVGIAYGFGTMQLHGYSDASWAPKPDRRSISGQIWILNGGPISWRSIRQKTIATSSCEAEYVAMATAAKECIFLCGILLDLGTNQRTVVCYADNQGAIALSANRAVNDRSKHIDICHHFVRDLVQDKTIAFEYIETKAMLADAMTKIATRVSLQNLFDGTGMTLVPHGEC